MRKEVASDRDSFGELYDIMTTLTTQKSLPLLASALPLMKAHFCKECEYYLRRRLSVCRTLEDLHLPLSDEQLDIMMATTLCHSLPGDVVPEGYLDKIAVLFETEPRVAAMFADLKQITYSDYSYYSKLLSNRYALMIRLAERSVLVEKLYSWGADDALRFIHDTREYFFPMCVYAKEHYQEFLGPVCILMEKMRNLCSINDTMVHRYRNEEISLNDEILALREENAQLRSMILELRSGK